MPSALSFPKSMSVKITITEPIATKEAIPKLESQPGFCLWTTSSSTPVLEKTLSVDNVLSARISIFSSESAISGLPSVCLAPCFDLSLRGVIRLFKARLLCANNSFPKVDEGTPRRRKKKIIIINKIYDDASSLFFCCGVFFFFLFFFLFLHHQSMKKRRMNHSAYVVQIHQRHTCASPSSVVQCLQRHPLACCTVLATTSPRLLYARYNDIPSHVVRVFTTTCTYRLVVSWPSYRLPLRLAQH